MYEVRSVHRVYLPLYVAGAEKDRQGQASPYDRR